MDKHRGLRFELNTTLKKNLLIEGVNFLNIIEPYRTSKDVFIALLAYSLGH